MYVWMCVHKSILWACFRNLPSSVSLHSIFRPVSLSLFLPFSLPILLFLHPPPPSFSRSRVYMEFKLVWIPICLALPPPPLPRSKPLQVSEVRPQSMYHFLLSLFIFLPLLSLAFHHSLDFPSVTLSSSLLNFSILSSYRPSGITDRKGPKSSMRLHHLIRYWTVSNHSSPCSCGDLT